MINDFRECLAQSHAASDLPLWQEVYRQAFPSMISMHDHRQNGDHQRFGIDRSITLANSKQLLIDEKVRGRSRKTGIVYQDILLEHVSVDTTGAPGWVCKPLLCDYIAYAIAPLGRCYLLPVLQLQSAWAEFGQQWRKEYGDRNSLNRGYTTISTPVPVDRLFRAIGSMLRVSFCACEYEEG